MRVQDHPGNLRVMDGYLKVTEIFFSIGAFLLVISYVNSLKLLESPCILVTNHLLTILFSKM